ncbi:arylformamidase [Elasticomyces elasticus]|nr:arylformamidase [Elasticomyces elasticus]
MPRSFTPRQTIRCIRRRTKQAFQDLQNQLNKAFAIPPPVATACKELPSQRADGIWTPGRGTWVNTVRFNEIAILGRLVGRFKGFTGRQNRWFLHQTAVRNRPATGTKAHKKLDIVADEPTFLSEKDKRNIRTEAEAQLKKNMAKSADAEDSPPRLKKAIAAAYSPFFSREIDPEKEVTITTGANEGMLSVFIAFLKAGDEVILFESFFD